MITIRSSRCRPDGVTKLDDGQSRCRAFKATPRSSTSATTALVNLAHMQAEFLIEANPDSGNIAIGTPGDEHTLHLLLAVQGDAGNPGRVGRS